MDSKLFDSDNVDKTVEISSIVMLVTSVFAFMYTVIFPVPYGGKYANKGWGILIPSRIAWILMEIPNVIVLLIVIFFYADTPSTKSLSNRVLLACFGGHYINRTFIYPFRTKNGAPMPISIMIVAMFYVTWNSLQQSMALCVVFVYSDEWLIDPRFILGVITFVVGAALNIQADNILMSLRSTGADTTNENRYKIPYGGLFKYVSGANYAGEIIEWFGFAIATWSLPGLAFAVFSFCNIAPRGYQHHQWYRQKFENYPKERKAIIPFVW